MTLIMTIIIVIQFLNPPYTSEKNDLIEPNPTIFLHKTLLSQEKLIVLEKNAVSYKLDQMNLIEFNKNENILTLKGMESGKSKRFIIVLLSDSNNVIRFSNIVINENLTNSDLNNLLVYDILIEKPIKIKVPSLDNYYIFGEWHLNIYLYNEEKELTAIITMPIVHSNDIRKKV